VDALRPCQSGPRVHFVSDVDGSHVHDTLEPLSPETTLFIVSSKSFTTRETLLNAQMAREWIERATGNLDSLDKHFVAATENIKAAKAFGIKEDNIFQFWDWVGGRYSLCSSVGLVVALSIGMDNFDELLAGARKMDDHFRAAPLEQNMPVILAMIGIWYNNFLGAESFAVIPYDQHLHLFPFWLQQTDMESNGKRITRDGRVVDYATSPAVWGQTGVNGQHSFYQLFHQGTRLTPIDFIAGVQAHHPLDSHQKILIANFLAQSKALMLGCDRETTREQMQAEGMDEETLTELLPHRIFPGNMPSNTLLFKKLTPHMLGMLVALYEHKVFVQGIIWEINSFDQWGVDLGKKLVAGIHAELEGNESSTAQDASTAGLLRFYREVTGD
jgi:glucose-6-phosphate isomerase